MMVRTGMNGNAVAAGYNVSGGYALCGSCAVRGGNQAAAGTGFFAGRAAAFRKCLCALCCMLCLYALLPGVPLAAQAAAAGELPADVDFWSDYPAEILSQTLVARMTDEELLSQILMFGWAGAEPSALLSQWVSLDFLRQSCKIKRKTFILFFGTLQKTACFRLMRLKLLKLGVITTNTVVTRNLQFCWFCVLKSSALYHPSIY